MPKAFTDDSDLGLCYEKKVIMMPCVFFGGDIHYQAEIIEKLLFCMKESNEKNNHTFPFYQLRVRPTRFDERPDGVCFELRWGSREELKV